jgi:hypothetical protein
MNMPRFTAEVSLYQSQPASYPVSTNDYADSSEQSRAEIVPQVVKWCRGRTCCGYDCKDGGCYSYCVSW